MMRLLLTLAILLAALPVSAQVYPSDPPLFEPFEKDAYGPGRDADATGRPFYWAPQGQATAQPDPTLQPQVNQYGLGRSADQYGRPIEPRMAPGFAKPAPPSPSQSQPCFGFCPNK